MYNFSIGIPTINRYDLLERALESYLIDFSGISIYIIDNGNQKIKITHENLKVIKPPVNLGVSSSWNALNDFIFNVEKKTHSLILNDDIYLGKNKEQIQKLIDNNPNSFITTTGTWCAFILPFSIYKSIGEFDKNICPAYFEDNDFFYRMKLQDKSFLPSEELNPFIYRNSSTIKKDKSLNKFFEKNKTYYVNKWGGLPHEEKFITPFNK